MYLNLYLSENYHQGLQIKKLMLTARIWEKWSLKYHIQQQTILSDFHHTSLLIQQRGFY